MRETILGLCWVMSVVIVSSEAGDDARIRVAVYNADKAQGDPSRKFSQGHEGLQAALAKRADLSVAEIQTLAPQTLVKHDVVVFHLLDQREVDFNFDRPTRFVDMEGGPPIMADPSLVGKQYQKAMTEYLDALGYVMRDAMVDYHRVNLNGPVGDTLARFLVGRKPKKKK